MDEFTVHQLLAGVVTATAEDCWWPLRPGSATLTIVNDRPRRSLRSHRCAGPGCDFIHRGDPSTWLGCPSCLWSRSAAVGAPGGDHWSPTAPGRARQAR